VIVNPGPPLFAVVPTGATAQRLLPASSIAGLAVGPESVVYIEPPPSQGGRGDDATAQRGNAGLPCATLDAAFALAVAALPDVTQYAIAPGFYDPPSTAVDPRLVIGAIDCTTGVAAIDGTGLGRAALDLSGGDRIEWTIGAGVQLLSDIGSPARRAVGSTSPPDAYFRGGDLTVRGLLGGPGGALVVRYAGSVILEQLVAEGHDPWTFQSVGAIDVRAGCDIATIASIDCEYWYDATDAKAPDTLAPVLQVLPGAVWHGGAIKIGGQAGVIQEPGSTLPVVAGDPAHPPSIAGGFAPTLQVHGRAAQLKFHGVDAPGFPDTATKLTLSIDRAQIDLGFDIGIQASPVVHRQTLSAIGMTVTANGAIASANAGIDMDYSGGSVPRLISHLQTNGAGADRATVIPPDFATLPQPASGLAVAVTFPFQLPDGAYSAICEADNVATLPQACTARTGAGCTANVTAAAGNIRVFVHYVGT